MVHLRYLTHSVLGFYTKFQEAILLVCEPPIPNTCVGWDHQKLTNMLNMATSTFYGGQNPHFAGTRFFLRIQF